MLGKLEANKNAIKLGSSENMIILKSTILDFKGWQWEFGWLL